MANLRRLLTGSRSSLGVPEEAGVLAGATVVGRTFSRGLMPRTTADQAVITGVSSAINYGMTAAAQSLIERVAFKIAGGGSDTAASRRTQRGIILAGDVAGITVGLAAQRLLEQRNDEWIARAWARTFSWRIAVGGLAGAIIVVSDEALDALSSDDRPWVRDLPVALPIGAALATYQYHRLRSMMRAEGVTHDAVGSAIESHKGVAVGRSVATGTVVSLGLYGAAQVEQLFVDGVATAVTYANPQADLIARPIGHLAALGLLGLAGVKAVQYVFDRAETSGGAIEAAYAKAPTSDFVSGGPHSRVSADSIGREGRRFVNMALTPEEIESVMGGPVTAPIRAFVGLETRATTSERADLAMQELETLGAFERSHIVFMSPTGTGYLNYVTAESLEYLTRGDVATVGIQYSLRPSPLSLLRVRIGIDQNNAFLHALKWRLAAIPEDRRPKLHIFGESLGATTAEDVFAEEGTEGLHRTGIDRGLFLGTPAATRFRERWLSDPQAVDPGGEIIEVDNYDEYLALPDDVRERARYVFLTHHNDSMPKFWFPLAVQAPRWMGPPETREPGMPKETAWRPYITFLITFVDVKNAMNVIPGQFEANGHDYRADLVRFTSLAYDLPADDALVARLNEALARRELEWAERRVIAQTFADARATVAEQFAKWGAQDIVDRLPSLPRPGASSAAKAPASDAAAETHSDPAAV